MAPTTAIIKIVVLESPEVNATTGKATTAKAESKSAPMLTARRPIWSTSQPPIGEINNPGKADIAATNPAKAGEPVSSRINHGIVIITIEFPKPDEKFES
jgi:hypothetical protein